jgi:hypothetical protein
MKKIFIALTLLAVASPAAFAGQRVSNADGSTTEVRFTGSNPTRKVSKPGKLIIVRDASGNTISVKRG